MDTPEGYTLHPSGFFYYTDGAGLQLVSPSGSSSLVCPTPVSSISIVSRSVEAAYKPVGFHSYPEWTPEPNHRWGPPWNDAKNKFWWKDKFRDREPIDGWYDNARQEITDRLIVNLTSHNSSFVCINWYWDPLTSTPRSEHVVQNFMASSLDMMKFCIGWDPQEPVNVLVPDDIPKIIAHWKTLIASPKYYRYKGKPLIFLGKIEVMNDTIAKNAGIAHKDLIAKIRKDIGQDVYLIAGAPPIPHWMNQAKVCGYDGVTIYNQFWTYDRTNPDAPKANAMPTSYKELNANYLINNRWYLQDCKSRGLDFWAPLTVGYDKSPWPNGDGSIDKVGQGEPYEILDHYNSQNEIFNDPVCKGGFVYAYDEDGEGGQSEPTKKYGYRKLEVFKEWRLGNRFPAT